MKVAASKLVQVGLIWAFVGAGQIATAAEPAAPKATATGSTSATPTKAETTATAKPTVAPTATAKSTSTAEPPQAAAAAESEAEPSAPAASDSPQMDGDTYQVRLRDLEQRVDELKEQIRRSHTRLSMLSDTILSGVSGGGRAEIQFNNKFSGAWHVVEAIFVLDGAVQYKKSDDTGVLAKQATIPIFSGSIPTGDHTLQVMLKLKGHGFGVFSYLRGIEADVKSSYSFTLSDGKVLDLKVVGWEKGGPTTPVEEQPDIVFSSTVRELTDSPSPAPVDASKSGASGATKTKKDAESPGSETKVQGGVSTP